MQFTDFWYVVAESSELRTDRALARRVLGERLVCFRGSDGTPAVLRDRCLHRNAPLSGGQVNAGILVCPYHGWHYDCTGRVTRIPSQPPTTDCGGVLPPFPVREQEGYVYVRLDRDAPGDIEPWRMHRHGEHGFRRVRLTNTFSATVTNCVENFIDVPHTAFVHRGIFRETRGERIEADVERAGGEVKVTYRNERSNLGAWSRVLNPRSRAVRHVDRFILPNITCVTYEIGAYTFIITSQAVPTGSDDGGETIVYTDLTYNFGPLTALAGTAVRRLSQRVIDQDIAILGAQHDSLQRYGADFRDTPSDTIHRCVESVRDALARGEDPRTLAPLTRRIEFLV